MVTGLPQDGTYTNKRVQLKYNHNYIIIMSLLTIDLATQ
jgi:hypothetical protein